MKKEAWEDGIGTRYRDVDDDLERERGGERARERGI